MNPCLKIWRTFAVVVAALVIVGSIAGIFGTWWTHSAATRATLQAFTIVDSAVGVVDTGAERVSGLVQIGRNEVQQVETTIVAVGNNITENRPVLTALSTRVSERLAPTVEQVRATVAPLVALCALCALWWTLSTPYRSSARRRRASRIWRTP